MHASSLENMYKCYRRHISGTALENRDVKVVDIGGADVNGSYSDVFSAKNFEYLGADLQDGPGVSIVMNDPYQIPLADDSVDIVVSGQMLEHCEFFWLSFSEMVRVLKKTGFIFLVAPSSGPIHRFPVDCYRFYPDAFSALAKYAECHLIDSWLDNRGPWNDLVGVFNKSGEISDVNKKNDLSIVQNVNDWAQEQPVEGDVARGETIYFETLKFLHKGLNPKNYLEIGVRQGKSLSIADCYAVGVDPMPDVQQQLGEKTRIIETTSDDFFEQEQDELFSQTLEFAFIDGMHLFEYVLRDFMNVERLSGPGSFVAIDDIFPNILLQSTRERRTLYWMGDVWKIYQCLKKYRPDLTLIPINTSPSGLLLITGLDKTNNVLWDNYNPIVMWALNRLNEPGPQILQRTGAVSPQSAAFKRAVQIIKNAREHGIPLKDKKQQILNALKSTA